MAKNSCLGIHYSEGAATAVPVERQGGDYRLGSSVSPAAPAEGAAPAETTVAQQLALAAAEGSSKLPQAVLSVGGRLYQTQLHHTEFTERKQINQTLRFDIEEDFAMDSGAMALCYQIRGSVSSAGTDLMVHVAKRDKLAGLLHQFDTAGLDALAAEPDVASWGHFLESQEQLPADKTVAVAAWSGGMAYILIVGPPGEVHLARSYLCVRSSEAGEVLAVELQRSLTSLREDQKVGEIWYHSGNLSREQIAYLSRVTGLECKPLAEPDAARAFAAGAALGWLKGEVSADFRTNGLAPRSLVAQRHRGLLGLAGAVSLLAAVLLVMTYLHSVKYRHSNAVAVKAMEQAYLSTHPGQALPRQIVRIPKDLSTQLKNLRTKTRNQASVTMGESASQALLLVLQMMNNLPGQFALTIDSLRVTAKTVQVSGSAPSLEELGQLTGAVEKAESQLQLENWYTQKSGSGADAERRAFNLSLTVKKTTTE